MKAISNTRLAGLILVLGMMTILITIIFEFKIGWVSSTPMPREAVPGFMRDNWPGLKSIWMWQALGYLLASTAYFHFTKIKRSMFSLRIGMVWTLIFILSLMTVVAFGITLGGYGNALAVYDEFPALFNTIRGSVLILYWTVGNFIALLTLIVFIFETFSTKGVIKRVTGSVILAMVLLCVFGLPILLQMNPKIAGIAFFLLPITIGCSYFFTKDK